MSNQSFSGKRCIPYYRVSTDDQAEKHSLPVQQQLMERWAEKNEVILDQHFIDDHSAKDFRRPGFTRLMEYLKTHYRLVDYVLIIDWSRFSRNIQQSYMKINELEQLGVSVTAIEQMVDDSVPESVLMKAIYLAAPDAENKRRSINVKKGMIASLRQGNWCAGTVPRGYWRDKNSMSLKLTSDAALITEAYKRISKGFKLVEVTSYLKTRGMNVGQKALGKLLRNPFYMGVIRHKLLGDEMVPGKQPQVISKDIWNQVQTILDGNRKSGKTDDQFPLKGTTCEHCDKPLTGYLVKRKQKADGTYLEKKSQPAYYRCTCCSSIRAINMHDQLKQALHGLSLDENLLDPFKEVLMETFERLSDSTRSDQAVLKKKLTEKKAFIDKLETRFIEGSIDSETYKKHRRQTLEMVNELEKELSSPKELSNPSKFIDYSINLVTKVDSIWSKGDISQKRRIQKIVFPDGLSYSKRNGQYRTPRVNSVFSVIDSLREGYNKKTGITHGVIPVYSPLVVRRGIGIVISILSILPLFYI